MDFKITEEKLLEVANRYGLTAEKSDNPGFVINERNVEVDELFEILFPEPDLEEVIHMEFVAGNFKIIKKESKMEFKSMNKFRVFNDVGVA